MVVIKTSNEKGNVTWVNSAYGALFASLCGGRVCERRTCVFIVLVRILTFGCRYIEGD